MATGDDAAAAGMDLVAGTAPVRDGDDEINKTRDYIAQRTSAVTPIAKGGTGSTTAAAARTALGLEKATTSTGSNGKIPEYHGDGNLAVGTPTSSGQAASKGYVDSVAGGAAGKVSKSGDTMTGNLFLPNATPATTGYTVCYLNSDGRVSRGASSERYKRNITRDPELPDVFAAPLSTWQMREDPDGVWRFGYVAEDLDRHNGTRGFVVFDAEGRPESYDMVGLLLAQVAQLRRELDELKS